MCLQLYSSMIITGSPSVMVAMCVLSPWLAWICKLKIRKILNRKPSWSKRKYACSKSLILSSFPFLVSQPFDHAEGGVTGTMCTCLSAVMRLRALEKVLWAASPSTMLKKMHPGPLTSSVQATHTSNPNWVNSTHTRALTIQQQKAMIMQHNSGKKSDRDSFHFFSLFLQCGRSGYYSETVPSHTNDVVQWVELPPTMCHLISWLLHCLSNSHVLYFFLK